MSDNAAALCGCSDWSECSLKSHDREFLMKNIFSLLFLHISCIQQYFLRLHFAAWEQTLLWSGCVNTHLTRAFSVCGKCAAEVIVMWFSFGWHNNALVSAEFRACNIVGCFWIIFHRTFTHCSRNASNFFCFNSSQCYGGMRYDMIWVNVSFFFIDIFIFWCMLKNLSNSSPLLCTSENDNVCRFNKAWAEGGFVMSLYKHSFTSALEE